MDISEVEALLRSLRILGLVAPQHVFIVDEPITMEADGKVYFRGVAPAGGNAIVLSKHADITTVPHEIMHNLGFGEFAADLAGKLFAYKYKLAGSLPFSQLRMQDIRYREVDDLPSQFKGRVRHYVRV